MQETIETVEIAGKIEAILFTKGTFAICKFSKVSDSRKEDFPWDDEQEFSAKGDLVRPQIGLEYRLVGRWVESPKWGRQLQIDEAIAVYPVSASGISEYLSENIKNIGPVTAQRLISLYGGQTLEICKAEPERVAREVRGISLKKAMEISESLCQNQGEEKSLIEIKRLFHGTGIPRKVVAELVERYGDKAALRVRENPYALTEYSGVSFPRADAVGSRCGISKDAPERIEAGIVYVIEQAEDSGNTCVPRDVLSLQAQDLLGLVQVDAHISKMIASGDLVQSGGMVQTLARCEEEIFIAGKVQELLNSGEKTDSVPHDRGDLAEEQFAALEAAMRNRLFILTGAPGTGKTYTVSRIIRELPHGSFVLLAPTGKAAARLSELSGFPAQTVHRYLLGLERLNDDGVGGSVQKNIIVDEASMIDSKMLAWILEHLRETDGRLLLVGDTNQLPSIGAGAVLRDLISSGVPCAELVQIRRQNPGNIIKNCHRIKDGDGLICDNGKQSDFFFFHTNSTEETREKILSLFRDRRLEGHFGVDPMREIQYLSPKREKGILSCAAMNEALREILNGRGLQTPNKGFRVGDKVMQTRNDYELDIVNGDVGYIRDFFGNNITVDFVAPDRRVTVPAFENDLVLAYACTVHKYQGSEVPVLVFPVDKEASFMLSRNLLYTAVSRAKTACVLVGQQGEVARAIRKIDANLRQTMLADFLAGEK